MTDKVKKECPVCEGIKCSYPDTMLDCENCDGKGYIEVSEHE